MQDDTAKTGSAQNYASIREEADGIREMNQLNYWEQPEVVERFAAREPDHRLVGLLADYQRPQSTRVLDLGCAGGRNTVYLVERGFDVWAIDASRAMVQRTRARIAAIAGPQIEEERVLVGSIDHLSRFGNEWFDLIVALGVYHHARTRAEWLRALAESSRVLKNDGRLLVNVFTPEVDLTGTGVHAVVGETDVYDGLPDGRAVLVDADRLDRDMAQLGLHPQVRSETVRVETQPGRRVSVNALYGKARG